MILPSQAVTVIQTLPIRTVSAPSISIAAANARGGFFQLSRNDYFDQLTMLVNSK